MSSGERPRGAAKGKQSDTEALCQPPPPQTKGPLWEKRNVPLVPLVGTIGNLVHFWYTNFWVPNPKVPLESLGPFVVFLDPFVPRNLCPVGCTSDRGWSAANHRRLPPSLETSNAGGSCFLAFPLKDPEGGGLWLGIFLPPPTSGMGGGLVCCWGEKPHHSFECETTFP